MWNKIFGSGSKPEEKKSITIAGILKGTEAGRMQSVGYMQVIPLVSDIEDHRIMSPGKLHVSTASYGQMEFENAEDRMVLVPAHAAYVVKQAAQDHAMSQAGLVGAKRSKKYPNAMCIQQSQGGLIKKGAHKMLILPFSLREQAYALRHRGDFRKIWGAISNFNGKLGVNSHGHLEYFLNFFKDELDAFVAEFEPVPKQVGAIVLIDGKLVGIERAPNYDYWLSVWPALIRECYGSLAIEYRKEKGTDRPDGIRVKLNDEVDNLEDIRRSLNEAKAAEEAFARSKVRELIDDAFERSGEEKMEGYSLETVKHDQLFGQIVHRDENVVYASLVLREKWDEKRKWKKARPFSI